MTPELFPVWCPATAYSFSSTVTRWFSKPANITNQILNFGLPAPIDVQVVGRDPRELQIASSWPTRIARIPGAADVHVHQIVDYPELRINVDRSKAGQLGLHAARRDQQPADLAQLQRPGGAQRVAELENGVNYRWPCRRRNTAWIRSTR